MPSVRVRTRSHPAAYTIQIGREKIDLIGEVVQSIAAGGIGRVAVVSNKTVFGLYGQRVANSLKSTGCAVQSFLIGDGERFKSQRTLDSLLRFLSESGFERSDAVVALGGGVVGDLAAFAASIFLRGIALVQIPTTLLSQIDSSVGGKTAINTEFGKNLVGTFYQPRAVLIDTSTLDTLPSRELTAGWCEAVKQGAAGDRKLFDRTRDFLSQSQEARKATELDSIIASQCKFKALIVAGDEHEAIERRDSRSRKILNLGHTTAHALESVTGYKYFRHGEAVGYGMIVAAQISTGLGLLDSGESEILKDAVRSCGSLPPASDLAIDPILEKIKHDKKNIRGKLNWILLNEIGRAVIVDGSEIPLKLLRSSLRTVLR